MSQPVPKMLAVPGGGDPVITTITDLNVRSGPGVVYDRVSFLLEGESARVLGVDPATNWYKIECPDRAGNLPECWVSGSDKFVTPSNTGGVPVAAVPPTPTPEPLPLSVGNMVIGGSNALLVYVNGDGLWGVGLDLSQNPPLPGEPAQLAAGIDIYEPQIAPDGGHVLYLTSTSEANALHVIASNGESPKTLISSADLVIQGEGDTTNLAALIRFFQWLDDSETIGFNTDVVNLVGPGVGAQEDWWLVNINDDAPPDAPTGPGGGAFAVAGDSVLFSQSDAIVRGQVSSLDREEVVAFGFINTASEYVFYPTPQWTAAGDAAYVVIPDADPWVDEPGAALWRIPESGPAEELGRLDGNLLFDAVFWSPDGSQLAYLNTESPPTLFIGEGDGQNLFVVDSDPRLAFHGWSPDGSRYLYSTQTAVIIGQPGGSATTLPIAAGQEVAGAWWVTDEVLATAVGDVGNWDLVVYNLAGDSTAVTTISNDFVQVNIWTP
ncbi:MAG: hypothetical protein ACE5FD_15485 [Anaerolineae bacterium]